MENDYVYVVTIKRGQAESEILGMWIDENESIVNYHKMVFGEKFFGSDFNLSHRLYFKFPANKLYGKIDGSDIKFGKTCVYRVKWTKEELKKRYEQVLREKKLERVLKDE
jgi:hypothetical protein